MHSPWLGLNFDALVMGSIRCTHLGSGLTLMRSLWVLSSGTLLTLLRSLLILFAALTRAGRYLQPFTSFNP
jgi:hypothetical protein